MSAITVHESPYSGCTYRPTQRTAAEHSGDFRIGCGSFPPRTCFSFALRKASTDTTIWSRHGHFFIPARRGNAAPAGPQAIAPMNTESCWPRGLQRMHDRGGRLRENRGRQINRPQEDCFATTRQTTNDCRPLPARWRSRCARAGGFTAVEVDVLEGRDCRARVTIAFRDLRRRPDREVDRESNGRPGSNLLTFFRKRSAGCLLS